MPPFHVEMRSYRIVGWVALILCTVCAIAAAMSSEYGLAGALAFFACVGLYVVLGAGSFDIDGEGVRHGSAFGKYRIRWDEISSVEVGEADGTFVLKGKDKRFVLSPAAWWAGQDKEVALAFVIKQVEDRKIPAQVTRTAVFKIMKNTRVS